MQFPCFIFSCKLACNSFNVNAIHFLYVHICFSNFILFKWLAPLVERIKDLSRLIELNVPPAGADNSRIDMYKRIRLRRAGMHSLLAGCALIISATVLTLVTSLILLEMLMLLLYIRRSGCASSRFLARSDRSSGAKRVAIALMIHVLFLIRSPVIEPWIKCSICFPNLVGCASL